MAELALAVVGTVDVALRSSLEIYRFLDDLKDAPKEIEELRSPVNENKQRLETLKQYVQEVRDRLPSSTASVVAGFESAVQAVDSAVKTLQRALNGLSKVARKYTQPQRTWSRIKFNLDGRQVAKYRERLEASKSSLNGALVLLSRFVYSVVRPSLLGTDLRPTAVILLLPQTSLNAL